MLLYCLNILLLKHVIAGLKQRWRHYKQDKIRFLKLPLDLAVKILSGMERAVIPQGNILQLGSFTKRAEKLF